MTQQILVVEDQEDNRIILRDLLTSVGYDVIEAVNGRDGVGLAESETPDLILMDIQLPIMDGYEATRRIGFEGRFDYAAIGTVVNLASRLCDAAKDGQILINEPVLVATEKIAPAEPLGELILKGLHNPVSAYNVIALDS